MKQLVLSLLIITCLCGCFSSSNKTENTSSQSEQIEDGSILNFEALVNEDISVFLDLKASLRKNEDINLEEIMTEINERMDVFDAYYNSISKKSMTPEQKQKIKECSESYYLYLNLLLDAIENMGEQKN